MFTVLAAALAVVASMPVTAAHAGAGACDGHGGLRSATAHPAGDGFTIGLLCGDGLRRGPFHVTAAGVYPCADHGGVHSATARPGEGVVEVVVYCNDGQSEGPYTFEIR